MKVYGYDDTGACRGELLAANIDASDLDFGLEAIAYDLEWECAFTAFGDAKKALMEAMQKVNADPELVKAVRETKASYVPIVEIE